MYCKYNNLIIKYTYVIGKRNQKHVHFLLLRNCSKHKVHIANIHFIDRLAYSRSRYTCNNFNLPWRKDRELNYPPVCTLANLRTLQSAFSV